MNIKANELRIGNHYIGASRGQIMTATWETIRDLSLNRMVAVPIKLDENILLKCGFEKYQDGYINIVFDYGYVIKYLDFRKDWSFGIEYFDPFDDKDEGIVFPINGEGLKYLHQLQNLYFALTGKELEVTL